MFGDAEAYQRFMGRWSALLAPQLVNFARLGGKEHVLDVGSGTGVLSFEIAKWFPQCRVTGVDLSKEYVAYAANRNTFGDRVRFQPGDAQKLDLPQGAFDAALSLLVFNFIPDAKKAVGEIRRVIKPGGPVVAAVWEYGEGMRMLRVFWEAVAAVDPAAAKMDEAQIRLCREGELAALWREGGLIGVQEKPLDITMQFQSLDDFWEPFLLGQGPAGAYVKKLDAMRRKRLRAELGQKLTLASESSAFTLPARAWAVRGTVEAR